MKYGPIRTATGLGVILVDPNSPAALGKNYYQIALAQKQKAVLQFIEDTPLDAWRNHGIGMIQAYLHENTEPEVRIHIWHHSLIRPGLHENGSIHDHRFDMTSDVILGELTEKVYTPTLDAEGDWEPWSIVNARSAGKENGYDGDCTPTGDRFSLSTEERTHREGYSYTLPRGVFHESAAKALTITVCTMSQKRGQARTLAKRGLAPVHAFGAPASTETIQKVLEEAQIALIKSTVPFL